METFTSELNTRLSQEMDSMMSTMHTQINRTKTSVLAERVVPEIQNIVSSMSSSGNKDKESGLSPDSQEVKEDTIGFTLKLQKRTVGLQLIQETTGTIVLTTSNQNSQITKTAYRGSNIQSQKLE